MKLARLLSLLVCMSMYTITLCAQEPLDQEQLQGKWRVVKSQAQAGWDKAELEFRGDQALIAGLTEDMHFTLNPFRNPKRLDIDVRSSRSGLDGIYSLKDDRLILCLGVDESVPRAKEFPPAGHRLARPDWYNYLVLERVQPK